MTNRDFFEQKAMRLAKKGLLVSVNGFMLYTNEAKTFSAKYGVKITPAYKSKKRVPCTVDWSRPFPNKIPESVYKYISGVKNTFPEEEKLTFGQRLYAIAMRQQNERQ